MKSCSAGFLGRASSNSTSPTQWLHLLLAVLLVSLAMTGCSESDRSSKPSQTNAGQAAAPAPEEELAISDGALRFVAFRANEGGALPVSSGVVLEAEVENISSSPVYLRLMLRDQQWDQSLCPSIIRDRRRSGVRGSCFIGLERRYPSETNWDLEGGVKWLCADRHPQDRRSLGSVAEAYIEPGKRRQFGYVVAPMTYRGKFFRAILLDPACGRIDEQEISDAPRPPTPTAGRALDLTAAEKLCKPGERVFHWMDVRVTGWDGAGQPYHVILFMPEQEDPDALAANWRQDALLIGKASHSLILDEKSSPVEDIGIIANVFASALNLCALTTREVSDQRLIKASDFRVVMDDLGKNPVILMETLADIIGKGLANGYPTEFYRDAFAVLVPRILESELTTNVKRLPFLVALASDIGKISIDSPAAAASLMEFQAFMEARRGRYDEYWFRHLEETQDPGWGRRLEALKAAAHVVEAMELIHAVGKACAEHRALEVDSPAIETVKRWLSEGRPAMGEGLELAVADTRSATGKLQDALLTVAFQKLARKLANRGADAVFKSLAELLERAGVDAVKARFAMSTGIMVGIEASRTMFNTAGVARALRICTASAEIEQAARQQYLARQRECSSWDRFSPPPADELEAMIWLQRLQWHAAGTFYFTLWNTITDERNLRVAIEEFNFQKMQRTGLVTGPAKWMLDLSQGLFLGANSVVPATYLPLDFPPSKDPARDRLKRLMDIYALLGGPLSKPRWIADVCTGTRPFLNENRLICTVAVKNASDQPITLYLANTATGLKYFSFELASLKREDPDLELPYGLGVELWQENSSDWSPFGVSSTWSVKAVEPKHPLSPPAEVVIVPGETVEFCTYIAGGGLPTPVAVRAFIMDPHSKRIEEQAAPCLSPGR